MNEVVEQIAVRRSPLAGVHEQLGATMVEREGWLLPESYGDAAAEYSVVREGGAGLIDFSSRGRVRVSGTEAVQFLNGLITNDVKALAEGAWMTAAFPNVQGRLVAAARVLHLGDCFLFDTEAATRESVFKTLERFTLAGDFRVADVTDELITLSLQGARAAEIIAITLGSEAASVERGRICTPRWREHSVSIIRATHTSEDGFDLFVNAEHAPALFEALLAAGARAIGFAALEILRIEAGLPRHGIDMDETNVVLETGLDEAVSYTKGCYVGQEIIARIHWRGHVAKRLAGLLFEDGREATRESKVRSTDGKEIGRLTSTAFSPRLNKPIALGLIKYDYLAPGTQVRVAAGEEDKRAAQVVELPFVRGSWFAETNEAETQR
ncbi:MAG TPA: aminomethyltransferase family protein [Pyrinomonadaceae bacterium]|jgi:folate-binding protein YgfZ